jgi:hypothetical protein
MNKTHTDVEGIVDYVLQMTVDNQMIYDTYNQEQKDCFHINIRKAVTEALKSQADEYEREKGEREKGEIVRDMYQLIENAMKEAHVISTDDDFRSGYFWGLKHLQVKALEIVKEKYGVDLSE